MPESTLTSALVDIVVKDQGEIPFKLLVEALSIDRNTDLAKIPSIAYVKDGMYQETPMITESKNKLDTVPSLPYHLLQTGVEPYVGSQGRFKDPNTKSLIMLTSVGCPYRCTYCAMPGMESTRSVTAESPDITIRKILELKEKFNLNAIAFHDEEFMVNPMRIIQLAEKMISEIGGRETGFRWWAQARMDTIEKLSNYKGHNYLPLLIESGLESFQPGIESGSNRILDLIKKKETREDFIRINKLLSQYSELQPLYNFMVGFPTETVDEMKETLQLAEQMISDNPYAMIAGVYIVVPYPGTEIYDFAIKQGFKPPATLEEWSLFNRQQLLTPWVKNNPTVLELAEFSRLTSRFIDGKRLPRRLDHTLGGNSGIKEEDFVGLSHEIRSAWRNGDFSNIELYRSINKLVLALYDTAKNKIKTNSHIDKSMGVIDERAKELVVDTALPLGGDQIKERDNEYLTTSKLMEEYGPLPKRDFITE
jgi:radical SAM superfamily enzyme YgiQ (UPF0313 family)